MLEKFKVTNMQMLNLTCVNIEPNIHSSSAWKGEARGDHPHLHPQRYLTYPIKKPLTRIPSLEMHKIFITYPTQRLNPYACDISTK